MSALPEGPGAGDGRAEGGPDYERVGRFIYGFHRFVNRDALTSPDFVAHAPPALRERARALAGAFDRVLDAGARVPDADLQAVLDAAAEVGMAIRAWRDGGGR